MGYDYDELFPGRFLKAGLFRGREVTLTIERIFLEEIDQGKKGVKVQAILSFVGKKQQLALNKTNGESLKGMFGRKTDAWIGKRITFYPTQVEAFGEMTPAIRVKGSPDIAADMPIRCKLGRNGELRTVLMKKTDGKMKAVSAPPPAAVTNQVAPPPSPAPVLAESGDEPDPFADDDPLPPEEQAQLS